MDVEKRLRLSGMSLAERAADINVGVFIARVIPALGIPFDGSDAEGIPRAGRGDAAGPAGPQPCGWEAPLADRFRDELDRLLLRHREEEGGPADLRRIAELTELLEGEQAAATWWHHAARMGDQLAQMIVDELEVEETRKSS